jgi:hypothetical protein
MLCNLRRGGNLDIAMLQWIVWIESLGYLVLANIELAFDIDYDFLLIAF